MKRKLGKAIFYCSILSITALGVMGQGSISKAARTASDFTKDTEKEKKEVKQTKKNRNFVYQVSKKGVTITKYIGKQKKVVIPKKLSGKKVIAIKAKAFKDCKTIREVTLPKTVKRIGLYEKHRPTYEDIRKENSTHTVFSGCKNLKNIFVKKGNKYFCSLDGVLYSKDKTCLYVYPAGKKQKTYTTDAKTKSIEGAAFANTSYLEKVKFGKNINGIGNGAFYRSGIKEVNLEGNITDVYEYAFSYCKNLEKVSIGSKMQYCRDYFHGCSALESIEVSEDNSIYYDEDGVLFKDMDGKKLLSCYPAGKKATEYTVPYGVIPSGRCFFESTYLKKVIFPEDSELNNPFAYCKDMTVVLPKKAEPPEYDSYAGDEVVEYIPFYECENITLIGYAGSYMENYAEKEGFTFIDKENPVQKETETKEIEYTVLDEKAKTIAITKINKVTKKLEIPSVIDGYTVVRLGYMKGISYDKSVSYIRGNRIVGIENRNKIKKVIIPDTVTEIGVYAFYKCENLTDITFSSNTQYIGANAFDRCSSIKKIKFPKSLKGMGHSAFANCTALESVTFKTKKAEVGVEAFNMENEDKGTFKKITMPMNYSGCLHYNAFGGYAGKMFTWRNFTNKKNGAFLCGVTSLEKIIFPKKVRKVNIPASCFMGSLEKLEKITIPKNVKVIDVNGQSDLVKYLVFDRKKVDVIV